VAEISGDRAHPKPMPAGFHAFYGPNFLPPQIPLCVAAFTTRFAPGIGPGRSYIPRT
jgi:hypothetical protein